MEHRTAALLFERGRAALSEGKRKYARQLFRNALKACGSDEGQPLLAAIHVEIGRVARDLGDNESASSHYRTAAEVYRGINDQMNLAHAIRHVADILRGMGRTAEAEPFIWEAIAIYRAQQPLPQLHLANALRVAALLKEQAQINDEALPLWVEARDLYRAVGVEAGVAEGRAHLAAAHPTQESPKADSATPEVPSA
jgi:tetratricopeptide (TPR) repeat protein